MAGQLIAPTETAAALGYNNDKQGRPSTIQFPDNADRSPVSEQKIRMITHGGPRMMRRGSTGYVHRTKARRQSGSAVSGIHQDDQNFLKLNDPVLLERIDSIKLLKRYQHQQHEEDAEEEKELEEEEDLEEEERVLQASPSSVMKVQRIPHRRKPRRMSGCAAISNENMKRNMPCLLQRENSVHLIQKRMPSRRASLNF